MTEISEFVRLSDDVREKVLDRCSSGEKYRTELMFKNKYTIMLDGLKNSPLTKVVYDNSMGEEDIEQFKQEFVKR